MSLSLWKLRCTIAPDATSWLGGPAGSSWLNFDVATDQGDVILPTAGRPFFKSVNLGAGKSITRSISLGKYYALGRPRNYRVKASVYFPATGKYLASRPAIFSILQAKTIWEQVIGIPRGKPNAGKYRHYSVMTYRDATRTLIYVGVQDETTKRVLATYPLGRVIEVRDPQITVDGDNRLHVLYLTAPRTYTHKVIDYGGATIMTDVYRDDLGAPQLMLASSGRVTVRGGSLFNPDTVAVGAAAGAEDGFGNDLPANRIRKLSERPPGMPDFSR